MHPRLICFEVANDWRRTRGNCALCVVLRRYRQEEFKVPCQPEGASDILYKPSCCWEWKYFLSLYSNDVDRYIAGRFIGVPRCTLNVRVRYRVQHCYASRWITAVIYPSLNLPCVHDVLRHNSLERKPRCLRHNLQSHGGNITNYHETNPRAF